LTWKDFDERKGGPQPMNAQPRICLNMIVRNEAHIVREVLDSVAPYISSWVVVDTGSDDGTQDIIRSHMAALGIPGELHERPWRDFGTNRSEAMDLARGHGDYIWVMDADDLVSGTLEFKELTADCYSLQYGPGTTYWRRQLFRDGLPWHYVGVLHEYADCRDPFTEDRLGGDYFTESRRLGGRNLDPQKYARDAEVLLAEVGRDPDNPRSVFYLAQSYFDANDFVEARRWYARRAEMAGFDEEVYWSLNRIGECMARLDEPWPDIQDAHLRAWEYRPRRAEPLHQIAVHYRTTGRYQLGHLFAERAAQIPLPVQDLLFLGSEVYTWRALDEQAVCASWIGKSAETFSICRRLLARDDIPDDDRARISANRDVAVPQMLEAATVYPGDAAKALVLGSPDSDVTITVIAGADRRDTEVTLNSLLNCCEDLTRISRVLVLDAGLQESDRRELREQFPFLEFGPYPPGARIADIRTQVHGRYWLHLGRGCRLFTPEPLLGRLTAVLEAEPQVIQVGINLDDATQPTGASAPESTVRRTDAAGRYVLTEKLLDGPAMFDTARLDRLAGSDIRHTATLDEVLCVVER
jgi:glycosyltransferase involved in cell wall biosynthesis